MMFDDDKIGDAIESIANAVTPVGVAGRQDEYGHFVSSLTEAVMSVASALNRIADSVDNLADKMN